MHGKRRDDQAPSDAYLREGGRLQPPRAGDDCDSTWNRQPPIEIVASDLRATSNHHFRVIFSTAQHTHCSRNTPDAVLGERQSQDVQTGFHDVGDRLPPDGDPAPASDHRGRSSDHEYAPVTFFISYS